MTKETPQRFLKDYWAIITSLVVVIGIFAVFGSDLKRAKADISELQNKEVSNSEITRNLQTNVYILCKSSPQKLPCIEPR